jgi:protein ImuB
MSTDHSPAAPAVLEHRRRTTSTASEKSVPQIIALLHKWGIHTCGDFIRLDKEEIRSRLGSEAVRLWEHARGKSSRLLKFVQPPESFLESFEFEYEIETAEPLLFVLRRFLEHLSLRLNAVYLVAKTLTLQIGFSNKEMYQRRFEIPEPTNSVALLFRMLQTHLEDFKSEHSIVAVSLEAEPIKPLPQQFGLFEASLRNPNQLSETLARLIALLGNDRVGTPVLEDTHRPDAFRMEPFVWELGPCESITDRPGGLSGVVASKAGAALRRFRPNRALAVFSEEGEPVHLRSPELSGAIAAKAGPYMASGNWWDRGYWARQEWDAELENGAICRFHANDKSWELDGIYD